MKTGLSFGCRSWKEIARAGTKYSVYALDIVDSEIE
jgi:hypothetical protein